MNPLLDIIPQLLPLSREEWKKIIEQTTTEPYIGIKQTIAKTLYEGDVDKLIKIEDYYQLAKAKAQQGRGR